MFLEFVQRVFRLVAATLRHWNTLQIGLEKSNCGLELFDVGAFHFLDDERRTRSTFLPPQTSSSDVLHHHIYPFISVRTSETLPTPRPHAINSNPFTRWSDLLV